MGVKCFKKPPQALRVVVVVVRLWLAMESHVFTQMLIYLSKIAVVVVEAAFKSKFKSTA